MALPEFDKRAVETLLVAKILQYRDIRKIQKCTLYFDKIYLGYNNGLGRIAQFLLHILGAGYLISKSGMYQLKKYQCLQQSDG